MNGHCHHLKLICNSFSIDEMFKWLILATIGLAIADQFIPNRNVGSKCPPNQVMSKNSNCRRTCNIRTVDVDCVKKLGCMCDLINGFLFNSKGKCVPNGKCDSPCDEDMGKVFDACGNSCPKTCDNMNDPEWKCKPECIQRGACRCNDGLVETISGNCVKPEDCSKQCPQFESYSECMANDCQNTCNEPYMRTRKCPHPFCKSGCICRPEWYRDSNGLCIPPHLCDVSCDNDSNARPSKCMTKCDNFKCSDIQDEQFNCIADEFCTNIKGCICKPGYYRQDGKCIPERDCPKCSGANEAYLSRKCDLKCSNIDKTCTEEDDCKEGCYCKLGYARNCDGECVPLKNCNQESCNGDLNAYFEQCDVSCQKTCEFKSGPPNCTRGNCTKIGGCVCKDGFVKDSDGICITPCACDLQKKTFLPPTPPAEPQCGKNEHNDPNPFIKCKDQTCDMYFRGEQPECVHNNTPCGKRVCKCLPAHVRNKKGECVVPQDCCDDPNSEFIAGPNTGPGGTCKNPQFKPCNNPWQAFGCQCKSGYLKISDCNPTCVSIKECCKYK